MADLCGNCGSGIFVEDPVRGDSICADCGCCLPDRIQDETLEKRNFSDSGQGAKDHQRGSVLDTYLSFAGQSTVIGKGTGNLQRTQNRLKPSAMSTAERNLADGFQNIRTYETMFSLPRLVVNTSRDLMAEYEKKKDKTMHGARSDAFALAVVFLAMSMHSTGKTLKEIAAVSKVDEKDIRSHIKRIQKTIPTALAKTTSPEDFIRVIINDIEAPFLLERLACEIISRALNHACIEGACVKEYLEGKRNSTLAAGAVLVAARKGGIPNIKEADVAAGAMIAEGTAIQSCRLIEGHWDAMFVDRSFGDIYEEMKALEERTRAHLATAAADATPRVKI